MGELSVFCNQELLRAASPSVDAGNLLAMIVKAENMVLGSLQHPLFNHSFCRTSQFLKKKPSPYPSHFSPSESDTFLSAEYAPFLAAGIASC